jgi:hypothetical protein
MHFGHWKPLGVSDSCWTTSPGWSNPRIHSTDAVAFRCTWKHLGVPARRLGVLTTSLRAPGSTGDKPESADHKPASADRNPGSMLNHCRAVWDKHRLWERCWCTYKS